VLRLVVFRRDAEVYALSALCGAVVEYVAFKRGGDVHIFWPHPFALYYALAMAQLTATLGALLAFAARAKWPAPQASRVAGFATLALGLAPSLAMTPDAVRSLLLWRRTGGRYDDNGALIRSDGDLLVVMRNVIGAKKRPGWALDYGAGGGFGWEHAWAWDGDAYRVGDPHANDPPNSTHPFWIARASALGSGEQLRIAAATHVRAYGDIWVVDQREPAAPIDAMTFSEREPHLIEWLAYGGWEPVRDVGPIDPLHTWEWRAHLGQAARAPEGGNPKTLEEARVLHNAAVALGASGRADALRSSIEAQLDHRPATAFEQGVRLMGVRVTDGVQPRLELWFSAAGPLPGDSAFHVRSTITAKAPLSLVPIDDWDREMAFPTSIPTKLWRAGFIYKQEVVLNHRIGVERYWGAFAGGPRRLDGQPDTTLAVIP